MTPTLVTRTKRAPQPERKSADPLEPKGDGGAAAPVTTAEGRDAMIRQTAYCFYELSGRVQGHDLDNWLKAEAQVDQELAAQSPAH